MPCYYQYESGGTIHASILSSSAPGFTREFQTSTPLPAGYVLAYDNGLSEVTVYDQVIDETDPDNPTWDLVENETLSPISV